MNEPTYAACLTPAGAGAIAVLALDGPRAWPAVRELFRPALPETPPAAGTVRFGRFGSAVADEVVLVVKGPQRVEVHCHGGRQVVAALLEALAERGLTVCSWPEFLRLDEPPTRAAALAQLAHARTVRTAAILLDQANGAYDRALADIRRHLAASGRLPVDDASSVVPASTTQDASSTGTAAARRGIDELLRFAALGRHLTEPWRVVVAGAPNVGKSSLVNALAGFQRSVVAPVPGTTRDVVSTELAIDGWPVELLDTAGLRPDAGDLEREGIALARRALAGADLTLWVIDATTEPVWPESPDVLHDLIWGLLTASYVAEPVWPESPDVLLVVNKTDQPPAWDLSQAAGAHHVSAHTGAGLTGLCAAIARRLVPDPPPAGAAVPFLASQVAELENLRRTLDAA